MLVDFIGKFENLQSDWVIVANKLGLSKELPHKNKNLSKRKHYTGYYSKAAKEIIKSKFIVDIEYFGYKFGD